MKKYIVNPENATINYSIIDESVVVKESSHVGEAKGEGIGITIIGRNTVVESGSVIPHGQNIDSAKGDK